MARELRFVSDGEEETAAAREEVEAGCVGGALLLAPWLRGDGFCGWPGEIERVRARDEAGTLFGASMMSMLDSVLTGTLAGPVAAVARKGGRGVDEKGMG